MGFGYSGLVGTALGFWAMAVVNRSVPATVTSLGILAGIALGTKPWKRWMRSR